MARGQKNKSSGLSEYWFPFVILKWRRKTLHMSLEQEACFLRLIMYYYDNRIRLPNDEVQLARIAAIPVEKYAELSPAFRDQFFIGEDGKLWNATCEEKLAEQCSRSYKNTKRAKKAARVRWDKELETKGQNALSIGQAFSLHDTKMLHDMTGHDRTVQEKKEFHPSKPDQESKTPYPQTPVHEFGTNAPNLTGAGTGFKSVGEVGGIGKAPPRFHLGAWLNGNEDARDRILRELMAICPGHDRNWLLAEYDRTSDKRHGVPTNPERAFLGWAKKLYGKK